jgi:uncharacterized coiled-coil protein SlyX
MAEKHPREFRPYRIAMYALFLVFTGTFIALVTRSVWVDLYGRGPVAGLAGSRPNATSCVDELEALFRKLDARSGLPLNTRAEKDWATFTREFEDRLEALQSRCVEGGQIDATPEVRTAIAESAQHLEAMRLHLSRCGEKGDEVRSVLTGSIAELRTAVKALTR